MAEHQYPCDKVVRLEAEVANIKERLDDMKGIGESLTRLTTMMELQQESNEKQNKLIEQQSTTLASLTTTVEKLADKVEKTEQKVDDIDKAFKEDVSKDKIDFRDIRNKIFWIAVGIAGSGIAYKVFVFLSTLAQNPPV